MRVGFIGLGIVGRPMARNLLRAGHTLVVNDLRPSAGETLVAEGATWATRPGEVAAASEVVFTSLPGPREVEAVALGDGGIIAAAPAGLIYLDTTTVGPACIRRVAAAAAPRDVHVLDVAICRARAAPRRETCRCGSAVRKPSSSGCAPCSPSSAATSCTVGRWAVGRSPSW